MAPQKKNNEIKPEDLDTLARQLHTVDYHTINNIGFPKEQHEERVRFIKNLLKVARGENLGGE